MGYKGAARWTPQCLALTVIVDFAEGPRAETLSRFKRKKMQMEPECATLHRFWFFWLTTENLCVCITSPSWAGFHINPRSVCGDISQISTNHEQLQDSAFCQHECLCKTSPSGQCCSPSNQTVCTVKENLKAHVSVWQASTNWRWRSERYGLDC